VNLHRGVELNCQKIITLPLTILFSFAVKVQMQFLTRVTSRFLVHSVRTGKHDFLSLLERQ
jgi:hypothetical protein